MTDTLTSRQNCVMVYRTEVKHTISFFLDFEGRFLWNSKIWSTNYLQIIMDLMPSNQSSARNVHRLEQTWDLAAHLTNMSVWAFWEYTSSRVNFGQHLYKYNKQIHQIMTEHKKDRLTKRLLSTQAHSYQSFLFVLFESFTETAPSPIQSISRDVHGISCCMLHHLFYFSFMSFMRHCKLAHQS